MQDIKKVFHHCYDVKETIKGDMIPLRFSDERLGYYARNPVTPYSQAPSGVTMEFYTDAESISFRFIMSDCQMEYFTSTLIDVYENDEYTATVYPAKHEDIFLYHPRNKGKVKICIYLPIGVQFLINSIDLGNWEPVEIPEKKVLFFGDSISQGFFVSHASDAYIPQIGRALGVDYFNHSVGGDTYCADVLNSGINYDPDVCVVEYGINDCVIVGNLEKITENIKTFYNELEKRFPEIPVIAVMGFHIGHDKDEVAKQKRELYTKVCDVIADVAKSHGHNVADVRKIVPSDIQYFNTDFTHLNDQGSKLLAQGLIPFIKAALN